MFDNNDIVTRATFEWYLRRFMAEYDFSQL